MQCMAFDRVYPFGSVPGVPKAHTPSEAVHRHALHTDALHTKGWESLVPVLKTCGISCGEDGILDVCRHAFQHGSSAPCRTQGESK
jgi:hypothetical protein